MTRMRTEGFEMGDIQGFATVQNTTIESAITRTGGYSARIGGASATPGLLKTSLSGGWYECYFRWGMYCKGIKSSNLPRIFEYGRSSTALAGYLQLTNDRYIELRDRSGTVKATSSVQIELEKWYLVELRVFQSASGVVTLKIDGTQVATWSGDTRSASDNDFGWICWRYDSDTDEARYQYVDDLAFNSSEYAPNNSWLGDGHIIALKPNGSGDASDWDGSDGDSVNNFQLVDEVPSDNDTTYVDGPTDGDRDMYEVEAFDWTGDKTILRVWAEMRAKDIAGAGSYIRLGVKTHNQVYTTLTVPQTSYARLVGSDYDTNPFSGDPWDATEIGSVQAVIEAEV